MRMAFGSRMRNLVLAAIFAASVFVARTVYSRRGSQALCRSMIVTIQIYQQRIHPYTHRYVKCRLQPTCSTFALHKFKSGHFVESFVAVGDRLAECARTPAVARPLEAQVPLAVITAAGFQRDDQAAAASAACCAGFGLIFVLVIVGLFVLSIILLVWVARDAKSRGVDNPVVWMILVFCTGIIGLIIYLAVRPGGTLVKCEHCPNKKLQYSKTCPHCGQLDSRIQSPQ